MLRIFGVKFLDTVKSFYGNSKACARKKMRVLERSESNKGE